MAEFRSTQKAGLPYEPPVTGGAGQVRPPRVDGNEGDLDEAAFLKGVEADLDREENRRKIRGILKGVALGTMLWILVLALVFIAI